MLALPPVALSVEHVDDILGALIPLVPHPSVEVRLSVMKTVQTILFCHHDYDAKSRAAVKDGGLADVVLDLTEQIITTETSITIVQGCLDILVEIATTANVPRLVKFLRSVLQHLVNALLKISSLHEINALLVTVAVLRAVGSRCDTETKNELATKHDLFTTLTPLLRSSDEAVSTWSSQAASAFSTSENIPLFISFLKGEDERLKLMAIRILKDLVAGSGVVSEDQKIAVVQSGVLSDLHLLLQKRPGSLNDGNSDPIHEQSKDATSEKPPRDGNSKDPNQEEGRDTASEEPFIDGHSNDLGQEEGKATASEEPHNGGHSKGLQETPKDATSEVAIASEENQSPSNSESNQEGQVLDSLITSTPGPSSDVSDANSAAMNDPANDKQPDSVEPSSEPIVDTSLIRQPAHAVVTLPAIDRAIELRDSAFAILDAIATDASDHGMEIIADAYVKVGIHTSLVELLKEPAHDPTLPGPDDSNRRICIFDLHELARGTDFAKRELIKTDIFRELRRIMDSDTPNAQQALIWCCLMIYHLLSSDEVNEDIVLAVINAELLERLVPSLKKVAWGVWEPSAAAQAIACLVMSTADTTWKNLREQNAITCLRDFLQTLDSVENLFAPRTWMLVEYLE
ncbi:armadillo-type protein [Mycena galopus ATCC 62051]|nr:armadillo-type protein [Mycena galopus ATCC 62051]